MKCASCGGLVSWRGPLAALTHTECDRCGRRNCQEADEYGNDPIGDRIVNCCFPDCGCDGARVCQAENGASYVANTLNRERGL